MGLGSLHQVDLKTNANTVVYPVSTGSSFVIERTDRFLFVDGLYDGASILALDPVNGTRTRYLASHYIGAIAPEPSDGPTGPSKVLFLGADAMSTQTVGRLVLPPAPH
jgi:hypothetical protein